MKQWKDFEVWLSERLQHSLPGYDAQKKMMSRNRPDISKAPAHARQSGVLILLYCDDGAVKTVLIERSIDGGVHSGQIALPGGKQELSDENILQTALREAEEEVALDATKVMVKGLLSPLYIPVSNFEVHPVIGLCREVPELRPSEWEVARVLTPDLPLLFSRKQQVKVKPSGFPQLTIRTPAYMLAEDTFVWGATAMILSELEAIWMEWTDR